ncbi:MAG: PDZ domain-containing protein [Proteobacteria bacterium]|nr:PDZ domain-containing protein [Pseudomonadota bacterium]
MPKLTIAVVVSLLVGFAIAALYIDVPESIQPVATGLEPNTKFDERLRALETAINVERQARQLLEEEIFSLYAELESLDVVRQAFEVQQSAIVRGETGDAIAEARRRQRSDRPSEAEQRLARLTGAGFSAASASWVVRRESELQMVVLRNQYDSMRTGEPMNPMNPGLNMNAMLREELGDVQYEMYLQAGGRSTAVGIGSVFESSPAQTAGLRPGDEITHYDGVRVFSSYDLTRQAMQGNEGERVVVSFMRDGIAMQIVMPRGPLGVSTRGRR